MTPEALSVYLLTRCHFDPDTVQDVIVKFMESPTLIQHPKSWGYRVAKNLQMSRFRSVQGHESPLLDDVIVDLSPDPLQVAVARERLDAYAANPTVTPRAKGRGKPGLNRAGQPLTRPEKWGFKEDYRVLKEAR